MKNLLIAGVGGQGSLLASRILGAACLSVGMDVKVSEVHGMSQRGGSVITYVRAGDKVASPLIPEGEADLLIALEQLEALRWMGHVRPDGAVVMSTQIILPMPVITGQAAYPEGIADAVRVRGLQAYVVRAHDLAVGLGSARVSNVVLLGAASQLVGFTPEVWDEALRVSVKPKFLEINRRAFALGRAALGAGEAAG
ncbi:MAG: indolepyruvate oxidoreductase subunit beta [Oscillospiraceae bacterium]|jgi:indolepyruvate ferredoxin oxidoreductase beta subunit|nr:indolepyruvate oxidoreductase subunit beta [Oscillospiraceae bacterium]